MSTIESNSIKSGISPLWGKPWEKMDDTIDLAQETLLRTMFALTEWYSKEVLSEILNEIRSRGLEDTLSRNSNVALFGFLGLMEEYLRRRNLKIPDSVLVDISEKFMLNVSRADVVTAYARYKKQKTHTNNWDVLRLKIFEYYEPLKQIDKSGDILESSLFVVDLLEAKRSWHQSPDAYAKGILEGLYQQQKDSKGLLFPKDTKANRAKSKLKQKFKGKIPRIKPWNPFELELIKDLFESGTPLNFIHKSFLDNGLRRGFNQVRLKITLMKAQGLLNSSERHQSLIDDALLSES